MTKDEILAMARGMMETPQQVVEYWRETGSINDRGEFQKWLHLWCMQNDAIHESRAPHSHVSFPWVNISHNPDLEMLLALQYITKLHNWPRQWEVFWQTLVDMRRACADFDPVQGPYWMLLPKPGLNVLAEKVVGLKNRLRQHMWLDGKMANGRHGWYPKPHIEFSQRLREQLSQFLIPNVRIPVGVDDETA